MTETKRRLRVFLCHASSDKPIVTKLYEHLVIDGFDAWLDKEKVIPGQDWEIEISKAVKNSDVVIVCMSSQSVTKEGFVQKEIKLALDIANEKPYGTIFVIPARLEDCEVPEQIRKFHWVDLFIDKGYKELKKSLKLRANNLGFINTRKKRSTKAIKERGEKTEQIVLAAILERINAINNTEVRRFKRYINTHHGQQNLNPFFEITQPLIQLQYVLENLQIVLSQISNIYRRDIGLSLIYKTDNNPLWQWLFAVNIPPDYELDLKELISNPQTTARQIIDGKTNLIFFPDKRIGVQRHQYITGKRDLLNGGVGSILCKNITLETNEKSIQAILSISTYGLQLCDTNDYDMVQQITSIVLPAFEQRIQLELASLYIKKVMSAQINT